MVGKELLARTFSGAAVPRVPFVPLVWSFAARVSNLTSLEMSSYPTLLANSLRSYQELLNLDAIAPSPPRAIEAEACGGTVEWGNGQQPNIVVYPLAHELAGLDISNVDKKGKIPVVVEATRRLSQTLGRSVGIVPCMSGPVSLGESLRGAAFWEDIANRNVRWQELMELCGQVLVKWMRSYGEMRVDALVLRDDALGRLDQACISALRPVFLTLHNIASFYNVPLILHTSVPDWDRVVEVTHLHVDGLSVGTNRSLSAYKTVAVDGRKVFAGCLAMNLLLGANEEVEAAALDLVHLGANRLYFVTTDREIPYQAPLEYLQKVLEVFRATTYDTR